MTPDALIPHTVMTSEHHSKCALMSFTSTPLPSIRRTCLTILCIVILTTIFGLYGACTVLVATRAHGSSFMKHVARHACYVRGALVHEPSFLKVLPKIEAILERYLYNEVRLDRRVIPLHSPRLNSQQLYLNESHPLVHSRPRT